MVILRRMRTLLFPPFLALLAIIFWSASLQIPSASVLDLECLVCHGVNVVKNPLWQLRALSFDRDPPKQRSESEIVVASDSVTGLPSLDDQDRVFQLEIPSASTTASADLEGGEDEIDKQKEIGEFFQELQRNSSSTIADRNSTLEDSSQAGERPLQPPNDPSIARNASINPPSISSLTADDQEGKRAIEEVERLMQFLRRSGSGQVKKSPQDCQGRNVYVYDLPPKFNTDLLKQCETLLPWMSMCDFVRNSGMGLPVSIDAARDFLTPRGSWFKTHQYALEMIFHARILDYSCRVLDPSLADVFYVPYYAGLDVMRWNFVPNVSSAQSDVLGDELMTWLIQQPSTWKTGDRRDHVIALGKISWDFRRMTSDAKWGSNLLARADMANVTKLLIERHPWHPNDVGVPHPTFFHPGSDVDITTWQARVLRDDVRPSLVAFAGQPRPGQGGSIRGELIRQCTARSDLCRTLDCGSGACFGPEATLGLFLVSDFCLQPVGDSPTRRSVFDSLLAGCIPVFFDPFTAYYQYPWHLPSNGSAYSVMIAADSVTDVDIVGELQKIPFARRKEMRHFIVHEILPGIVYAQPGSKLEKFEDAFDVAMRNVIARVASREVYDSSELR
ncbi:galactosyltransferase-like protein [Selaginella moellendorffii]|uniref:Galactosyltransferase-like protein n=1 Tax=Selaginella moellendorffii TaxID=88036 RepID=D8TDT4_SELML|nr:xyloglucan-specific galacturonosyltransferase 1 [Selaginella moellendorffii]EFJ05166.1 galactosyltransferase-like protein [Selaginella moellendorffii]|eukprot:XP_002993747.1 xyloglucan-specific galacturonosyltransferase 1 [Selaginella moellendorffii]